MFAAVLFDLDGTLLPLDFEPFFARYLASARAFYREAIGIDILPASMAAAALMVDNDGRATNAEVFWTALTARLGLPREPLERLYDAFVAREAALLGQGIVPDPAARAVVARCLARGARVALATNPVFPRVMVDARAAWAGIDTGRFALVTSSERMRFCKPRPEYYLEVAEQLGVDPRDCIMIGNDVAMDLAPAAAVGMTTCALRNRFLVAADGFVPHHACALDEVPALLAA